MCDNQEDIAKRIADTALKTLANSLLGNQESRLATIKRVRETLVQQLDQYEELERNPPEPTGKKGWMLSMKESIYLINGKVLLQIMLKDRPGRVNLGVWQPSAFASNAWNDGFTCMAWEFDFEDDNGYCWFCCLGQDRFAPGDIITKDDRRWVVDEVKWVAVDSTWWVHGVKPQDDTLEATVPLGTKPSEKMSLIKD
jgi:hypothetical protein